MNPILAQFLGALGTLALFSFGILIVAWDNANNAQHTGPFSFRIFWADNKDPFLRAIIYGILIVTGLTWITGIQDILQYIGLNITVPITSGGAALLGGLMYDRIRQKRKSKTDN
jgi:hypothetical protein